MQEFTFHYHNFLMGGPPKPPIQGGGHPLPHTSPLRRQKFAPPFETPGYGPGKPLTNPLIMQPELLTRVIFEGGYNSRSIVYFNGIPESTIQCVPFETVIAKQDSVAHVNNSFKYFHEKGTKKGKGKNCPPPSSHETNVLSKFQENWAKNVTSTVFTCFHYIHIKKNAPPTGGHVFSPIPTIFKLVRDINKTNVLTNFHDDGAKIVTSRVFTRKTSPPTGGHVFQRIGTILNSTNISLRQTFQQSYMNIGHEIFELGRDFIGTKLLTKFHEDGTRNVASRVDGRTYDGQRPVTKAHLSNQIGVYTMGGESSKKLRSQPSTAVPTELVRIAAVAAHVAEPAADRVLHSVGSELQSAPDCKAAYPGEVTAEGTKGINCMDGMVTGSIPTVEAFFRFQPKTPSTVSRPKKQTRENFNKPEAFDAIKLK
ncbi:hypothetical protein DPMN_079218 [Dreissena polymorpha]|uniref:Uncharacterized protein n=1 Tax=Dreissena polymorpha TaxID=45954 RepID=A0A9D4BST5_DREPO|nr:hypothetical protein DPMN_079218 [Dreissena polymorpha]